MEHLFLSGLEGRACEMWSIAGITTDLEAAFPTDEKVMRLIHVRRHSFPCPLLFFARVYIFVLDIKVQVRYIYIF